MAFVVKDRVKETTTTTGTSDLVLSGSVSGFQSFSNALADGDTTYYALSEVSTNEWEVGVGTWTESTTTLARTTVLASSNSGSKVSLTAQAEVFISQPAGKAAFFNPDGDLDLNRDPQSALQAATKQYVDTIAAAGLHYHDPVRVEQEGNLSATYSNGTAGVGATLTNNSTQAALTIDGVALSLNDRVLIYEQTNGYENGVYTVTNVGSASTNWVLTRATDADSYAPSDPDSLGQGDAFFVLEGTAGAGELYVMNTEGTITFGTTNITFTQVASTAVYSAGTGLTLTGTEFAAAQDISTTASPSFAGVTVGDGHTIGDDADDNLTLTSSTGENITYNSAAGTHAFKSNGTSTVTFDGSGNITVTGTVDGRDIATDGSKLDGIETGATADQTKADIDALGINAATLDSLDSTQFIRSDANDTSTGKLTLSGTGTIGGSTISNGYLQITDGSNTIGFDGNEIVSSSTLYIRPLSGTLELNNGAATNVTGNLNVSSGVDVTGNITVTGTVDGVDIAALNTSALTTSTTFGGDVSGTYNAIVVANDSHTHSFGNLTDTNASTLNYSTTGHLEAGRGGGGVSLTINDGYGNANVAFNHKAGTPDSTGKAGRISVNVDNTDTNGGVMQFHIGDATSGVTASINERMRLTQTGRLGINNNSPSEALDVTGNVVASGTITSGGNTVLTTADYDVQVCHLKSNVNSSVTQGVANEFTVNFNLEEHNDTSTFSHSSGVVTVATAGWYRIVANLVYENGVTNQRNTIRAYVKKNGTEVTSTATYDYDRGTLYGEFSNNKINTMLYLAANDTIEIANYGQNIDGTVTIQSEECEFMVSSETVQATSSNADTVDGLHASQFLRSDASDTFTQISGTTVTADNVYVAGRIYHEGDTDTSISFGANVIALNAGGSQEITVTSTGVQLGDTGNGYFQPVSGDYGSIQIDGGAHNGWEGYSIGGRITFMHDNASGAGIYNDVDNEWFFYAARNASVYLYYNGLTRFSTTPTGVDISGDLNAVDNIYVADNIYHEGDTDTRINFGTNHINFYAGGTETLEVWNSGTYNYNVYYEDYDALSGTSVTVNCDTAQAFSLTMTGNTTFTFNGVTNAWATGFVLELTGNGSTVTWPASVDWAGGAAPDAPASGETDIYVFWTRDGGTTWYGILSIDAAA